MHVYLIKCEGQTGALIRILNLFAVGGVDPNKVEVTLAKDRYVMRIAANDLGKSDSEMLAKRIGSLVVTDQVVLA